jgi:SAM-dependent methyltransferase
MTEKVFDQKKLKQYYGTILQKSADLKTSACCCTNENISPAVKAALSEINDEIITRFYGCGSPLPPLLEGCKVVDLGCGTGRDAYVAARLAGPTGYVIGVDMTDEQLDVATRNLDSQMKRFGYKQPNIDFRQGYIEDLKALDIADNSVDVVISNCVLNLSPDKKTVFSEIFRILKPGGELYFADVFAGRRVPAEFHHDPILHGECLAGAMYREDFRRLLRDLGCQDYRAISSRRIELNNPEIEHRIGMIDFYSMTVRAFKLDCLEDICEDYGQAAIYKGTIPEWPHYFDMDDHHRFFTGKPMLVCGNTAAMLQQTRYSSHFHIHGDSSVHFGPFECSPAAARTSENPNPGGACC